MYFQALHELQNIVVESPQHIDHVLNCRAIEHLLGHFRHDSTQEVMVKTVKILYCFRQAQHHALYDQANINATIHVFVSFLLHRNLYDLFKYTFTSLISMCHGMNLDTIQMVVSHPRLVSLLIPLLM